MKLINTKMNKSNKILPHFWFDKEAREAAEFYVSLFPDSNLTSVTKLPGTPSGDAEVVRFELQGLKFAAISAGPIFKLNASLSLYTYCGTEERINELYSKLTEGGSVLMPLDEYPWSKKYAWVSDRFGLSWQLDIDKINSKQKIVPSFLFTNKKSGLIKEAVAFYASIFPESKMIMESPYDPSAGLPEGTVLFSQFALSGFLFNAMSSTMDHGFDFNEAFSFIVYCDTQEEIDYYWDMLTDGGMEQQCGWLKDKFGVSWQIVPSGMDRLMHSESGVQTVMQEILKMNKLDLKKISEIING